MSGDVTISMWQRSGPGAGKYLFGTTVGGPTTAPCGVAEVHTSFLEGHELVVPVQELDQVGDEGERWRTWEACKHLEAYDPKGLLILSYEVPRAQVCLERTATRSKCQVKATWAQNRAPHPLGLAPFWATFGGTRMRSSSRSWFRRRVMAVPEPGLWQ